MNSTLSSTNSTDITTSPEQQAIAQAVGFSLAAVVTLVFCVSFVLSCAFRKHQPLRSRGIIHFILNVYSIYAIYGILIPATTVSNLWCYINTFVTSPIGICAVALLVLQRARLVFINNLQQYRALLFDEGVKALDGVAQLQKQAQTAHQAKKDAASASAGAAASTSGSIKQNLKRIRKSLKFESTVEGVDASEASELHSAAVTSAAAQTKGDSILGQVTGSTSPVTSPVSSAQTEQDVTSSSSNNEDHSQQLALTAKQRRLMRLVKVLRAASSPWFNLAWMAFFVVLWYVLHGIFVGLGQGDCLVGYNLGSIWVDFACFFIIIVVYLAFLLFDVVSNFKLIITFQWIRLIKEDTMFLRLELVCVLFYAITLLASTALLQFVPQTSLVVRVQYPIIGVFIWGYSVIVGYCAFVGMVLVATIVRWARRRMQKNMLDEKHAIAALFGANTDGKVTQNELLAFIAGQKELFTAFKSFAKSEWSLENVALWETLTKRDLCRTLGERRVFLLNLWTQFVQPGSPMEANLPGSVVRSFRERIQLVLSRELTAEEKLQRCDKDTKSEVTPTSPREALDSIASPRSDIELLSSTIPTGEASATASAQAIIVAAFDMLDRIETETRVNISDTTTRFTRTDVFVEFV